MKVADSFVVETDEIIERFVTLTKPTVGNDGVHIGNAVLICDDVPVITSQSIISHEREEVTVYLIDFAVKDNQFEIEIMLENP